MKAFLLNSLNDEIHSSTDQPSTPSPRAIMPPVLDLAGIFVSTRNGRIGDSATCEQQFLPGANDEVEEHIQR